MQNLVEWKNIYEKDRNMSQAIPNSNSLDLGCGVKPRNPFGCENPYGLDLRDLEIENVVQADVVLDPIPFDDHFLMVFQHLISLNISHECCTHRD